MDPSSGAPRPEKPGIGEPGPPAGENTTSSMSTATDVTGGTDTDTTTGDVTADLSALARFEFSDAGTKILMVEWLPEAAAAVTETETETRPAPSSGSGEGTPSSSSGPGRPGHLDAAAWQVSWRGKSTFLPARDVDLDDADTNPDARRRRIFFLLPPDAPVPPTVTITPPGRAAITVKPLPAIFPEGFASESLDSETKSPSNSDTDVATRKGTRGVLHTIWAKKRLRELDREMDAEMRANAESVGLEMALAEKQWIEASFLKPLQSKTISSGDGSGGAILEGGVSLPRSPAGRLGDKLKGLRLATSPSDLVPTANTFITGTQSQTLSPQDGDMAVSSFSAMSRPPMGAAVGIGGPTPVSLDAALHGETLGPRIEDEDELFALPISPRSPDMKKSPFSTLSG